MLFLAYFSYIKMHELWLTCFSMAEYEQERFYSELQEIVKILKIMKRMWKKVFYGYLA
jgi:hypothetical protein